MKPFVSSFTSNFRSFIIVAIKSQSRCFFVICCQARRTALEWVMTRQSWCEEICTVITIRNYAKQASILWSFCLKTKQFEGLGYLHGMIFLAVELQFWPDSAKHSARIHPNHWSKVSQYVFIQAKNCDLWQRSCPYLHDWCTVRSIFGNSTQYEPPKETNAVFICIH